MTLYHLPFPSLVTSFQLVMAVSFIFGAKASGILNVDPIKMEFVVPYLYYIVGFALGVYCNMKSLSVANVETVIVTKALSPCLVSILDALFLGREFPSPRSWGAIALIGVGAFGYASQDEKFQTQGASAYVWPFCCKFSFRSIKLMINGKWLCPAGERICEFVVNVGPNTIIMSLCCLRELDRPRDD
eukprot:scaffold34937_cov165-Amphora_coffeaeformis.AAC.7